MIKQLIKQQLNKNIQYFNIKEELDKANNTQDLILKMYKDNFINDFINDNENDIISMTYTDLAISSNNKELEEDFNEKLYELVSEVFKEELSNLKYYFNLQLEDYAKDLFNELHIFEENEECKLHKEKCDPTNEKFDKWDTEEYLKWYAS